MTVRVLIADDHPAYRAGLRLMLDAADDLEVVAEADTGARAVELAAATLPDVVVMDLRMPDLDGIEATRRLLRDAPNTGVVVLTMFEDDESVFAAMRAGARGYLLKDAEQDDILLAIRAIAHGDTLLSASIASKVLEHFASGDGSARAAFPTLTERELEVLDLVAAGKGNAVIAHDLMLTLKTVRNHVSNIFTKLQVPDRATAIVRARDAGFGAPASRP
jgi:DNA-binding NarL/FixJ family response regulator